MHNWSWCPIVLNYCVVTTCDIEIADGNYSNPNICHQCRMLRLMRTGTLLTVLLSLIVIIAAADDDATASKATNRMRRQYGRRPVQQHHTSRNPINYFESIKEPKAPFSPPAHEYPAIPYRPAYHAEPVKTVIPFDLEEPKPVYYPEVKSAPAPPPYSHPTPVQVAHKQKPYYPAVKPDYGYGDYCPKIAGLESHCRPIPDCAIWYDVVLASLPESACKLADGSPGSCCPDIPYNGTHFI